MRILFLCSWLEPSKKKGWFFVEQANYLNLNLENVEISFVGFQYTNIPHCIKHVFTLNGPIETLENKFDFFTFKLCKFKPKNNLLNSINKILLYLQFNKLNLEKQFQILHAQSFFDAGIYSHWISRKFKIKSVLTEHNQLNFLDSRFDRKTIKNALNAFDTRIAVSKDVVRQFASSGFFNDFEIVGNPLDDVFMDDKYLPNQRESIDQIVFVHAGAFTPIKNQKLILDLIKKLDNEGFKIKFNWIGVDSWGVDTRDDVKNEIQKRIYSENIEISVFERMSKKRMLEIYKSSHLAISTSICETFGISSLEAMSTGLPLLSTQNGGVSEFANSENSILVPINDIDQLYQGFMTWYNNRESYDGKRISENIKQKFSPKLFAEKMMNIYNK